MVCMRMEDYANNGSAGGERGSDLEFQNIKWFGLVAVASCVTHHAVYLLVRSNDYRNSGQLGPKPGCSSRQVLHKFVGKLLQSRYTA